MHNGTHDLRSYACLRRRPRPLPAGRPAPRCRLRQGLPGGRRDSSLGPRARERYRGGSAPTTVPVNVLVTPRDQKRLRQLSLDTGLSLQKLGHEAWNRLRDTPGLESLEAVAANVPSGRARR